jgi:hypothetical protein
MGVVEAVATNTVSDKSQKHLEQKSSFCNQQTGVLKRCLETFHKF